MSRIGARRRPRHMKYLMLIRLNPLAWGLLSEDARAALLVAAALGEGSVGEGSVGEGEGQWEDRGRAGLPEQAGDHGHGPPGVDQVVHQQDGTG